MTGTTLLTASGNLRGKYLDEMAEERVRRELRFGSPNSSELRAVQEEVRAGDTANARPPPAPSASQPDRPRTPSRDCASRRRSGRGRATSHDAIALSAAAKPRARDEYNRTTEIGHLGSTFNERASTFRGTRILRGDCADLYVPVRCHAAADAGWCRLAEMHARLAAIEPRSKTSGHAPDERQPSRFIEPTPGVRMDQTKVSRRDEARDKMTRRERKADPRRSSAR